MMCSEVQAYIPRRIGFILRAPQGLSSIILDGRQQRRGGRMRNPNCEARNELHEKFALATIRFVTQVSKVMAAALISDLFEFEQGPRRRERD
jgi:hypothetical protein